MNASLLLDYLCTHVRVKRNFIVGLKEQIHENTTEKDEKMTFLRGKESAYNEILLELEECSKLFLDKAE